MLLLKLKLSDKHTVWAVPTVVPPVCDPWIEFEGLWALPTAPDLTPVVGREQLFNLQRKLQRVIKVTRLHSANDTAVSWVEKILWSSASLSLKFPDLSTNENFKTLHAVTCSSLVVVFTVVFSDALSWDCCLHKPLAASLNMVSFSSKLSCLAIGKARGLLQRESIKQLDSYWRWQTIKCGWHRHRTEIQLRAETQAPGPVLKRNWWEINCSHRLVCSQRHRATYSDLKFTFMHFFSEAELSKPKRICMSLLLTALGWQINSQFCNWI